MATDCLSKVIFVAGPQKWRGGEFGPTSGKLGGGKMNASVQLAFSHSAAAHVPLASCMCGVSLRVEQKQWIFLRLVGSRGTPSSGVNLASIFD